MPGRERTAWEAIRTVLETVAWIEEQNAVARRGDGRYIPSRGVDNSKQEQDDMKPKETDAATEELVRRLEALVGTGEVDGVWLRGKVQEALGAHRLSSELGPVGLPWSVAGPNVAADGHETWRVLSCHGTFICNGVSEAQARLIAQAAPMAAKLEAYLRDPIELGEADVLAVLVEAGWVKP
jgi:hypothetical protein